LPYGKDRQVLPALKDRFQALENYEPGRAKEQFGRLQQLLARFPAEQK
jgi:hypothetical protein